MRSAVSVPSLPPPQAPTRSPAAASPAAAPACLPLCGPLPATIPPAARQALVPSLDKGLLVLQALRAVVGDPSACFKDPHQLVCFSEATCTSKDLCLVMPTGTCHVKKTGFSFYAQTSSNMHIISYIIWIGGGKSLIPLVASNMYPDKLVVVVTTLNMNKAVMRRRADAAGVSCWEWDDTCLQSTRLNQLTYRPQQGLLLVSADRATNATFHEFLLHQFAVHKSMARLFMDEAHLVLSEFRDIMFDVHAIRPRHCTWVFLTATLPPNLEQIIWGITASEPTVLRPDLSGFGIGTARLNLEYAVSDQAK